MKLFGRLCFSLFLLASPLSSHAGYYEDMLLAAVKEGKVSPQAALEQAKRRGADLTKELAPYLFPPHWQQFFTHFNGLAYDQLAQQLDDLARHHHAGAFIAASLQDIPNIPARNPGTPLSQWLTTVRNALFDNGGRLQHNQDRKPQFEKFILAAQVQESISHAEDVAFCARVFNRAANGNQTIQAAYADELGNIPCPGINGMNIAGDVAQRVINNRLPRNQASIEAQIHAHTQHLTQGNFGLTLPQCQNIARAIVTDNKTPQEALTTELGNINCEGHNVAGQVANFVIAQGLPLNAATRAAFIAKRVDLLKARNLGLDDAIYQRVAETVTDNNSTYLAALTQHLKPHIVEQNDLKADIAQKIINENKTLAVATREASVARRKNFLKGFNLGLADDICERVADDVTTGDTYLKALQNRMPREDYEGENLTPHIAKILWEGRLSLPQATQQAKINKLASVWRNKNLELSEADCKKIAEAVVLRNRAPKDALIETLQTLAPYKNQAIHTAVASFIFDNKTKLNAAIRAAKIDIEKEALQKATKDLSPDQLKGAAAKIVEGLETAKALATVIADVKGDDGASLILKTAEAMLKGKSEKDAAGEVLIAHRIPLLEKALVGFTHPQLKTIAEIMTKEKKSQLDAVKSWLGPQLYDGKDVTSEIADLLFTKKAELKAARETVFVNHTATKIKTTHPTLASIADTLAKTVYADAKHDVKAALKSYLTAELFKHAQDKVKDAVELIMVKGKAPHDAWADLCITPLIHQLKTQYTNVEPELLEPWAKELVHSGDKAHQDALFRVLLANPKYAELKDHFKTIVNIMVKADKSYAAAGKEAYIDHYTQALRQQGFDFLDIDTFKNICEAAYPSANILDDGFVPFIFSQGIENPHDFIDFLKKYRKSIAELKMPFLVEKKKEELQAKHSNIPEETLRYAAQQLVGTKKPFIFQLLSEALVMTKMCEASIAKSAAFHLLKAEKPSLQQAVREAKIDTTMLTIKAQAAHLSPDVSRQLATIMVDEQKPSPEDALAFFCKQQNYAAQESETITDMVFKQGKTLKQIEDEFGFKKYQAQYPGLTEEQARQLAALASKHKVAGLELLEKFLEAETGMRDRSVLKLAAKYFNEEGVNSEAAIGKGQRVNALVVALRDKIKIWANNIQVNEPLIITMAEEAFNNQYDHDLSMAVAKFMEKNSVQFPLTFPGIEAEKDLHLPAYATIAKKMLAENGTFENITTKIWRTLDDQKYNSNIRISFNHLLQPHNPPEYCNAFSTLLPKAQHEKRDLLENIVAFLYLIPGYNEKFFEEQAEYAKEYTIKRNNNPKFQRAQLRTILIDALAAYYRKARPDLIKEAQATLVKKQNLDPKFHEGLVRTMARKMLTAKKHHPNDLDYEQCSFDETLPLVLADIRKRAQEFGKSYPYLPFYDVEEIACNQLLLNSDIRKTIIERFIAGTKAALGLNAQKDVNDYIPKLAAFITDKENLTFAQAQKAYTDFLTKKIDDLEAKKYGLSRADCQEIIWQQWIHDKELKVAIGEAIANNPTLKFPEEIFRDLRPIRNNNPLQAETLKKAQMKKAKETFATAVAERLLQSQKPLTIEQAMQEQRVPTLKGSLRKNGLLLSDSHLMTVAKTMIQEGKDLLDSLITLFKSEPKNLSLANLEEKDFGTLARYMEKGAFFIPARYLTLYEKRQKDDIPDLMKSGFTDKQAELALKLICIEAALEKKFVQFHPKTPALDGLLYDAMGNHWTKATELLTQLNEESAPSEFDLTLTLYHYLEPHKNKPAYPLVETLKVVDLTPAWAKARKWTYAHGLQTLNLDNTLIDIDGNFGKNEIEIFAKKLAEENILTPEEIFTTPLGDIVKTYRSLFNLIPNSVKKKQQSLTQNLQKGRKEAEAMEAKYLADVKVIVAHVGVHDEMNPINAPNYPYHYWKYDARNPRYYTAAQDAITIFDKNQKNSKKDPLINVVDLKNDPYLRVSSIDKMNNVVDEDYKMIRNTLQAAIANSPLSAQEKENARVAIGRFFSWGDLDMNTYNPGEDKILKGSAKEAYRKRIKRVYDKLLKPAVNNNINELLGLLNSIIVQGAQCIDASRQALDALEGGLPAEEKLTLFSRLAGILRAWRMDKLMAAGLRMARENGASHIEPEYALFMKIASKHPLSIRAEEESQSYHGAIKMEPVNLTKAIVELLEKYRTNIVDIVRSSIKYGDMPPEDNSSTAIYLEQIKEWAQGHPKYCNVIDLASELTDKVTVKKKTVEVINGVKTEQLTDIEEVVIKPAVIRTLLKSAEYIESDD